MGHDHDHSQGESYYLDQICTITACGLLGVLTLLMWQTNLLFSDKNRLLADQFKVPVLLGAVGLTGVAVLRAGTLWAQVGRNKASQSVHFGAAHDHCGHDREHLQMHGEHDHAHSTGHHHHHKHGEHCDHDHVHGPGHHHHDHQHYHDHTHNHDHAHLHDHGHDHGFAPWRYAVLVLPLLLAALLLYYHYQGLELAYSAEREKLLFGRTEHIEEGMETETKSEIPLRFDELTVAAASTAKRSYYEGHTGKLKGKFMPYNDREFTLFRLKITCCASDAIPLKVRIISDDPLPSNIAQGDWVETSGKIQFRKVAGKNEFIPVLLTNPKEIKKTTAGTSLYEQ